MPASPSTSSSASSPSERYRFRPRYKLFAYGMLAIGAVFAAAPYVRGFEGDARTVALVIGVGSVVMAALYLISPAWRMSVVVDDDGVEIVTGAGDRKFRLAWSEIPRVVASPSTHTCFVDGGSPERSFKVPGKGAPAPYAIDRAADLYRAILERVPADVVEEVVYLEAKTVEEADREPAPPSD